MKERWLLYTIDVPSTCCCVCVCSCRNTIHHVQRLHRYKDVILLFQLTYHLLFFKDTNEQRTDKKKTHFRFSTQKRIKLYFQSCLNHKRHWPKQNIIDNSSASFSFFFLFLNKSQNIIIINQFECQSTNFKWIFIIAFESLFNLMSCLCIQAIAMNIRHLIGIKLKRRKKWMNEWMTGHSSKRMNKKDSQFWGDRLWCYSRIFFFVSPNANGHGRFINGQTSSMKTAYHRFKIYTA